MLKMAKSHNVKESEKTFLDPSLYPDPYQKLTGSILAPDLRPSLVEICSVVSVTSATFHRFKCSILTRLKMF